MYAVGSIRPYVAIYYAPGGGLDSQDDPAIGGQPAETIYAGYDSLGNPTAISGSANYLGGVTYDHLNGIGQTSQFDGVSEIFRTYTRDPGTERTTELLTQRVASSNAVVSDRSYTYQNAGSITSIIDRTPATGTDAQCFTYDYAGDRGLSD